MKTVASGRRATTAFASKRLNQSILLPFSSAPWEATKRPCTWKIGSAWISTSPGCQPQYFCSVRALLSRLPCESIAPLLRPVVPLVYRIAASSSALRSGGRVRVGVVGGAFEQAALRSVPSVKTCAVPALNAICEIRANRSGVQTTTLGSALPMKYSSSAVW